MAETIGINHLGLAVRDLDATTAFFVDLLGRAPAAPACDKKKRSQAEMKPIRVPRCLMAQYG